LTKISNSDHVLMLLRAQLERAKKAGRTGKANLKKNTDIREGPVSRVRSLALYDNLSQDDLARALVSRLLMQRNFRGSLTKLLANWVPTRLAKSFWIKPRVSF
jgi:hypothetical protein